MGVGPALSSRGLEPTRTLPPHITHTTYELVCIYALLVRKRSTIFQRGEGRSLRNAAKVFVLRLAVANAAAKALVDCASIVAIVAEHCWKIEVDHAHSSVLAFCSKPIIINVRCVWVER